MMHCEPGCSCCAQADTDAVFTVTINPEARVEAHRADADLESVELGEWLRIPISISNEAYVTGPLAIRWSAPTGVEVDAPETVLTGAGEQMTEIGVRLAGWGDVDITLRFWALGALGGLANKNTVSLYVRCCAPAPSA